MLQSTRIRLLADLPEGATGDVRVVASHRARHLVSIGQAEQEVERVDEQSAKRRARKSGQPKNVERATVSAPEKRG